MAIDYEFLQSQIDIQEYISQYVDLEYKNGEWWGLSPFKDENTASFSVDSDKNVWYDYSSGFGGGIITFVKAYHNVNTTDAVQLLCKYSNISEHAVNTPFSAISICKKFKTSTIEDVVYDPIIHDESQLYQDENDFQEWMSEGISYQDIVNFGIKKDRKRNIISIPIKDAKGDVVNYLNRNLDVKKGQPKYIYQYKWQGKNMAVLYGLDKNKEYIKDARSVIIVEGAKSVLKLNSYGYKNVVAILTSHLNDFQFKELIKLRCKEFIFALDNGIDIRKDHKIVSLRHFGKVSYLHDDSGVLTDKDAPVDCDMVFFDELLDKRQSL